MWALPPLQVRQHVLSYCSFEVDWQHNSFHRITHCSFSHLYIYFVLIMAVNQSGKRVTAASARAHTRKSKNNTPFRLSSSGFPFFPFKFWSFFQQFLPFFLLFSWIIEIWDWSADFNLKCYVIPFQLNFFTVVATNLMFAFSVLLWRNEQNSA